MNLRRLCATLHSDSRRCRWMLGGCAAVAVRPEGELPKPLVVPTPAKVGVVVTTEAGNYTHKESRASVNYEAQLGPSHKHIVEEIFRGGIHRSEDVRHRRRRAARTRPDGHLRTAHRTVFVRQRAGNRRRVYRGHHPLPDPHLRAERRADRHAHAHRLRQRPGAEDRQRRRRVGNCRVMRPCAMRRRNSSRSSRHWMLRNRCWLRRRWRPRPYPSRVRPKRRRRSPI